MIAEFYFKAGRTMERRWQCGQLQLSGCSGTIHACLAGKKRLSCSLMLPILEEPSVRLRAMPVSVEGYHCMMEAGLVSENAELIRGVILDKIRKSPLHSFYCKMFLRILSTVVPAGHTVQKEDPLTLRDSEPEPDLAVVAGSELDYRSSHPTTALFVMEIATSSERLDREMASIYAEAGVQEYWIVLAQKNCIEVYQHPVNGVFQTQRTYQVGETIRSVAIPEWTLDLGTVFSQ